MHISELTPKAKTLWLRGVYVWKVTCKTHSFIGQKYTSACTNHKIHLSMENTETELNKQLANYTNNILSVTSSISSLHLQKQNVTRNP